MSYTLSGILINKNCKKDRRTILSLTGTSEAAAAPLIRIKEATKKDFRNTAVFFEDNYSLIINHRIGYDLSVGENNFSGLDSKLLQLANRCQIMAFYMDGVSGSYGFSIFEHKQRIRRRFVNPNEIIIDEGNILDEEHQFDPHHLNDEHRIFVLAKKILGSSFFQMIFDNKINMEVYR